MVGLSLSTRRNVKLINDIKLTPSQHFHDTVFTRNDFTNLWIALLKLRYNEQEIDLGKYSIKKQSDKL